MCVRVREEREREDTQVEWILKQSYLKINQFLIDIWAGVSDSKRRGMPKTKENSLKYKKNSKLDEKLTDTIISFIALSQARETHKLFSTNAGIAYKFSGWVFICLKLKDNPKYITWSVSEEFYLFSQQLGTLYELGIILEVMNRVIFPFMDIKY